MSDNLRAVHLELIDQLRRQIDFIITSCRMFDGGRKPEAIRIAQAARVLFHQTNKSTSLVVGHLKRKDIRLRSTVTIFDKPGFMGLGFLGLEGNTGHFRPVLDDTNRSESVPFQEWWQNEKILRDLENPKVFLTRKDIILFAANLDGGAHVDTKKNPKYELLKRGLGLSVEVGLRTGSKWRVTFKDAHLAALRQIGHEIITSPELDELAGNRSK